MSLGVRMRRIAVLVATSFLAAALAGPAGAKTLTYCAEGSPEGFDPAPFTTVATYDASSQAVYNRLVQFKRGTTQIIPALAESWTISDDGLEYTFRLRPGVKFQTTPWFTPTRELDADDVVFSFQRQWKTDDPWYGYAGGAWPAFTGMSMPGLLREIRKVDDRTVVFVLSEPMLSFLADLAMDFASILSQEYAGQLTAAGTPLDLDEKPVGTGPFQLVEYAKDAVIRFQANPHYWRGKPAVDELVFDITPDSGVRFEKLKAGDCQVMPEPNPADIAAIRSTTGLAVAQAQALDLAYLAYNTTEAPFDSAKVRKALAMAINRQAIVDTLFQGTGTVADGLLPSPMLNNGAADIPYDPEGARKLLDEAGAGGLKTTIGLLATKRPYDPDPEKMAEMIKADLGRIGVDAKIVAYPLDEFMARSVASDRDGSVLSGWTSDNGDPDNMLAPLLACDGVSISNQAIWCNQSFEDALIEARATLDRTERDRLYREALGIVADELPLVPIAHSLVTVAMTGSVRNFVVDPFGRHSFEDVDIGQ